jgi:hypothetical protein
MMVPPGGIGLCWYCAEKAETYFLGDGRTYERQKGELLHPEQGRT